MSTTAQKFAEQPPVQSEIRSVATSPEGVIKAPYGTIVRDASGHTYVKKTDATVAGGWELLLAVKVFNTFAELQAYAYYTHHSVAFTLGYATAFDFARGMCLYVFDSTDLTADNSATIRTHVRPTNIASDLLPGRWRCWDWAWQG